ncbi:apolipoprotein N-acyltransferase [Halanaerobiaceae bacterium Z-7014]|uniref:Apolipoprotein N-acyltransferase n=1 Tax=Halonatronomonas betaini TaxID=2778430 RepID=A0A931AUC2_9FIRM|nr:apolipoprotein N-acyltransferase [Halonatronomonas betaini]MBF8436824.1 apolipoprotein N-acyltransferase [Halonatronomonas betaini]
MILLVILSGILLTLPLGNPELYWLAWFGLVPTIIVMKRLSDYKQVLVYGWVLGITLAVGASYWLYHPINDFSGLPFPLVIIFLMILFTLSGLNMGLWSLGYKFIERGSKKRASLLLLAGSWVAFEYLINFIFPYYPFGNLGLTQTGFDRFLQLSEYGGIFLLSFIVVLINGLIYKLFTVRRLRYLLLILIVFLASGYFSGQALDRLENSQFETGQLINIGIIATEIPQEEKWQGQNIEEFTELIAEEANQLYANGAELVIMPETALTFDYPRNGYYRNMFQDLTELNGYLLLGSQAIRDEPTESYNSMFLLDNEYEILGRYDKIDLIPGEFIPLVGVAEFFTGRNWGSITRGQEPEYFEIEVEGIEASFRVLTCSEILHRSADYAELSQHQFIVNPSNEAWFGDGNLQTQMWQSARLRAVETRMPVVKAGNKAIDGYVLPDGRYQEIVESSVIEIELPAPGREPTVYQQYGNIIVYLSILITLLGGAFKYLL